MAEAEPNEIIRGTRGGFHWLISYGLCFGDLMEACPEVVVGRYGAISAFDSGSIRGLSEEDLKAGWELRNEIAYSPRITNVKELDDFYDNSYDEWYVFGSLTDLGRRIEQQNIFQIPADRGEVVPFVNYHDLGLNLRTSCCIALLEANELDHARRLSIR